MSATISSATGKSAAHNGGPLAPPDGVLFPEAVLHSTDHR